LKSGLSIDETVSQLRINLAVDSNYFFEIAKLRAARLIFHKLLQQYSAKNTKVFIVAYTSSWNKTIYDAYNNVLRTTTEAMSAIIGGADAVKIASFDKFFKNENDFSSRIAENQQHILKEESHLDEVVDPAAGSYYIESITKEIADVAWKIFEEIEEKGGYNACKDSISDDIDKVSEGKLKDVSSRKKPILGVNIFPNINEEILQNIEVQSEQKRAAKEIEDLRLSNERKFLTEKRPVVFLLTYGNVGMRRARAGFAMNFLACAGFEIRDNNGFKSIEEGLAEANKADADIIVFCSSDEEYLQVLGIQLNKKENTKFIIAGNMGENETKFTEHGIDLFIHVKTNLLQTLQTL
jgi:methylmalonyl-CoA mutase